MKVKGANFFELHVEKIVLGVVAAMFVLVLVIQLGADGPTVTVNNQPRPLDQAYEPAEDLARRTRTGMNMQEPPLPEVGERIDLLGRFHAARQADLAPRDRIAFGPAVRLGEIADGEIFGNARLADLAIPAPADPAAYSFAATLDPWSVQDTEGLAGLVPPQQPYDKAAVSVQATFDAGALYAALRAEPEGDLSPWPITWWNNSIEILAVRLERQRRNSDGSWGEAERVPLPPGALDIPGELAEMQDLTPGELKRAVEDVQRNLMAQVRRPSFYPVIAGDPWIEPREGIRLTRLESGVDPEVTARQRRLAQIDANIERSQAELAQLGAGPAARPGAPQPPRGDRAREGQIRRVEGRLEALRAQRERVVTELTDMGFPPEEPQPEQADARQRPDQRFGRGARDANPEALAAEQTIEVWAHDVTAQPGETYRYRVILEFNNPAYGQTQFLVQEQQSLATPLTVFSDPSPWTEPVIVAPMTAFFVTSGSEAQQGAIGMRTASAGVEVFTFRYGYYRRGTVSLEPGDPVATWADLPEGLPVFDVSQPPPQDGPAMPAPVAPDARGARRNGQDAGGLGVRAIAEADAYLLDVYESAAREAGGLVQGRAPRIVAFGNSAGEVLRRLVGEDRRSPLYERLAASAAAGQTQGQPEPEPEQPQIEQRQRREREPEQPPQTMPPGGGGG